MELENISIEKYLSILKSDTDKELILKINEELNKSLGSFGSGMDLSLFMLQKDLLITQCKLAIFILNRDEMNSKIYSGRVDKLRIEIERKTKKVVKSNPYKDFISWMLSLKKHYGSDIDISYDLLYFSEATKQMLSFYEAQTKPTTNK